MRMVIGHFDDDIVDRAEESLALQPLLFDAEPPPLLPGQLLSNEPVPRGQLDR